jgi:hypothetical protein
MDFGHAVDNVVTSYIDRKAGCRRVGVSYSDGGIGFNGLHIAVLCYRLNMGASGVRSDWRRRDAAHRHSASRPLCNKDDKGRHFDRRMGMLRFNWSGFAFEEE